MERSNLAPIARCGSAARALPQVMQAG